MISALFLIALGLIACFFRKQLALAAARRHIAYDAVWFYQLLFLFGGIGFVAFGVATLLGWLW